MQPRAIFQSCPCCTNWNHSCSLPTSLAIYKIRSCCSKPWACSWWCMARPASTPTLALIYSSLALSWWPSLCATTPATPTLTPWSRYLSVSEIPKGIRLNSSGFTSKLSSAAHFLGSSPHSYWMACIVDQCCQSNLRPLDICRWLSANVSVCSSSSSWCCRWSAPTRSTRPRSYLDICTSRSKSTSGVGILPLQVQHWMPALHSQEQSWESGMPTGMASSTMDYGLLETSLAACLPPGFTMRSLSPASCTQELRKWSGSKGSNDKSRCRAWTNCKANN